jgi:hypothetical protein
MYDFIWDEVFLCLLLKNYVQKRIKRRLNLKPVVNEILNKISHKNKFISFFLSYISPIIGKCILGGKIPLFVNATS